MFVLRNAAFASLTCAGLLASAASAQTVAVPDAVPSGIQAMVSINDTNGMWKALSAAPARAQVEKMLALPAIANNPEYVQFKSEVEKVSSELGFSVWPDSLLGETLNGLDVYVTKNDADEPGVLVVAAFDTADQAGMVVAYMTKKFESMSAAPEAEAGEDSDDSMTSGDGGDASAVTKSQVAGVDVYSGAGGEVSYAAKGNVFYVASSADALGEALAGGGEARLAGNADLASMWSNLAGAQQGQMNFYVGAEGAELVAEATGETLPPQALSFGGLAGTVSVKADRVDSVYTSIPKGVAAELAANAPAATTMEGVKSLIGADAIIGWATNMFDGDTVIDLLDNQFGGPGASDQMFAGFESETGLSVRNDILPAFGPDMSFALNGFSMGGMIPDVDIAIGLQVKDAEKAAKVQSALESMLAQAFTEQMQGGDPSAPAVTPASEDYNGVAMRSVTMVNPMLPVPIGLVHATNKGYMVISYQARGVKSSLDTMSGSAPSVTKSASWTKATTVLPGSANQLTVVNARKLGEALTVVAPLLLGNMGLGGDEAAVAMQGIEVLKSLGTGYATSTLSGGSQLSHSTIIY